MGRVSRGRVAHFHSLIHSFILIHYLLFASDLFIKKKAYGPRLICSTSSVARRPEFCHASCSTDASPGPSSADANAPAVTLRSSRGLYSVQSFTPGSSSMRRRMWGSE